MQQSIVLSTLIVVCVSWLTNKSVKAQEENGHYTYLVALYLYASMD